MFINTHCIAIRTRDIDTYLLPRLMQFRRAKPPRVIFATMFPRSSSTDDEMRNRFLLYFYFIFPNYGAMPLP